MTWTLFTNLSKTFCFKAADYQPKMLGRMEHTTQRVTGLVQLKGKNAGKTSGRNHGRENIKETYDKRNLESTKWIRRARKAVKKNRQFPTTHFLRVGPKNTTEKKKNGPQTKVCSPLHWQTLKRKDGRGGIGRITIGTESQKIDERQRKKPLEAGA